MPRAATRVRRAQRGVARGACGARRQAGRRGARARAVAPRDTTTAHRRARMFDRRLPGWSATMPRSGAAAASRRAEGASRRAEPPRPHLRGAGGARRAAAGFAAAHLRVPSRGEPSATSTRASAARANQPAERVARLSRLVASEPRHRVAARQASIAALDRRRDESNLGGGRGDAPRFDDAKSWTAHATRRHRTRLGAAGRKASSETVPPSSMARGGDGLCRGRRTLGLGARRPRRRGARTRARP